MHPADVLVEKLIVSGKPVALDLEPKIISEMGDMASSAAATTEQTTSKPNSAICEELGYGR